MKKKQLLGLEKKQRSVWVEIVSVYAFIFLVWGIYRWLFQMPVWFEEVVLKGLVFGIPVYIAAIRVAKWKWEDLGLTGDNLWESVNLGLALGVVLGLFGQIGNFIRHGGLQFSTFNFDAGALGAFLILALVTAFWEELLFSGYILQRLERVVRTEWSQLIITASLFVVLHIPSLFLIQRMSISDMVMAVVLLFLLELGSGILMLRYRNLAAPILAHAMWGVTVFLFR